MGWCQSSGRKKLIWKLNLRILVLNHINSDIIEPRVEMEVYHPSSHRVLCTPFSEHLITLSHLELPLKLFNNSVAILGMLQRIRKSFSIFKPIPPMVSPGSLLLIVWDSDEMSPLPGSLPWLYLQHLPTLPCHLERSLSLDHELWGQDYACFISVSQCISCGRNPPHILKCESCYS